MKNAKRKGSRQEHRSMALLETMGYRCTRSAASLGEWDVVAIGTSDVLLVQVKSNRMPGTLERYALQEFVVPAGVRKQIHVWKDRARLPEVHEL